MRALPCLALLFALLSGLASPSLHPAAAAATPSRQAEGIDLKNDIAGYYRLENDRVVRLVQVDQHLYIDLNRRYRKELLPAGHNLLASRDGKLTVHYLPDRPVEHIVIRHRELPAGVRLGETGWRQR